MINTEIQMWPLDEDNLIHLNHLCTYMCMYIMCMYIWLFKAENLNSVLGCKAHLKI